MIIHLVDGSEMDANASRCKWYLCAASSSWQDFYVSGIGTVISVSEGLGANGIYGDTRGQAALCYNGAAHGHPDGGGSYYLQGRRTIIEQIDSLYADTTGYPTANEGPFDVKIGWYDYYLSDGGYMMRDKLHDEQMLMVDSAVDIPLLPCVFHDYQATITGIIHKSYSEFEAQSEPLRFPCGMAYAFSNGHMIAFRQDPDYIGTEWSTQHKDVMDYIVTLARWRRGVREYLVYGEWMRPPALSNVRSVTVHMFGASYSMPDVFAGAYVYADSTLGTVFTNYTSAPDTIHVTINVGDYGISPTGYDVYEIDSDGNRTLLFQNMANDPFSKNLIVGGMGTRFLEIVDHQP
jgi:hypothetical protein